MKLLELKDVSYMYSDGTEYVLRDMNMEFEPGKTYVIKGKSGSGKTTLLSLLAGLETCKMGDILFKGKSLKKMNLDKYRNSDIGIVFQSFNLLVHLNALENVILSMDVSNVKNIDKKKEAYRLLESVGITKEKAERRILKLSGGEQQRVAIARSLAYNPEIILADEPTGNLDSETENEIINIFRELAKKGKCIIIVTYSDNLANSVDKVYNLKSKRN